MSNGDLNWITGVIFPMAVLCRLDPLEHAATQSDHDVLRTGTAQNASSGIFSNHKCS